MDNLYVVFMGGSGARVAQAMTWLTSAGLFNDCREIHMLMADAHRFHQDRTTVTETVKQYMDVRDSLNDNGKYAYCKPIVHLYDWNILPSDNTFLNEMGVVNLRKIAHMGLDGNPSRDSNADAEYLMDALFTTYEQTMLIREGYHGHPAVGAAFSTASILYNRERLKTLSEEEAREATDEYQKFMQSLKTSISGKDTSVFLIGSLFGGTGAACMSSLSRDIRKLAYDVLTSSSKNKFNLHGVFLGSYFAFQPKIGDDKNAIEPDNFPNATKTALTYYHREGLLKRDNRDNAVFDSIYVLGFPDPDRSAEYTETDRQTHSPHIVELEAAMAVYHGIHELVDAQKNVLTKSMKAKSGKENLVSYHIDWESISYGNGVLLNVLGKHTVFAVLFITYWFREAIGANGSLKNHHTINLLHEYLIKVTDGGKTKAGTELHKTKAFLSGFLSWYLTLTRGKDNVLSFNLIDGALLRKWVARGEAGHDVSKVETTDLAGDIEDLIVNFKGKSLKKILRAANTDASMRGLTDQDECTGLLLDVIQASI